MITVPFLAEWALRSSMLIGAGALLLRVFRVKDPSTRLAAWTAMLCASLLLPALCAGLPALPLTLTRAMPDVSFVSLPAAPLTPVATPLQSAPVSNSFDWLRAGVLLYIVIAGGLLLRLCAAIVMNYRLLRGSRSTGRTKEGMDIRESDRVTAPVTLGIVRPAIVLPVDWGSWDDVKLDAVLAHERSHIQRRDPAIQLLSSIHRALLWHSPLSWFLHCRIVRVAEEASDDAAVAVAPDRASYAELLLEFMQRGVRGAHSHGLGMARYGRPEQRIHRILEGTALSEGLTRWSIVAILALGSPLAYVAAAAHPQSAPQAPAAPAAPQAPAAASAPEAPMPQAATAPQAPTAPEAATAPQAPATPQAGAAPQASRSIRRYMIFDDDSVSGSWDSRDEVDNNSLRARFGRHFAWFRQNGQEYVVTDSGVLSELHKAMEPQKEVNQMQAEVNKQQAVVNDMQSKVNAQQNEVNALQNGVNRRQDIANRIQKSVNEADKEALIRELESAITELRAAGTDADQQSVNRRQSQVNEAQGRVNAEQHKVNEQQSKVNEQQHRVSAEFNGRIQDILDSAIKRHLAQLLM